MQQGGTSHEGEISKHNEHDLIIIGAGSAGSLLANRLSVSSEFSNRTILVLEAGQDRNNDPNISTPGLSMSLQGNDKYDWSYVTDEEPGLNDRKLKHPRGKVVGGTSSINSHSLVFPSRFYHDFWAENLLSKSLSDERSVLAKKDQNQLPRRDMGKINWTWSGMQQYYSRPFEVLVPNDEICQRLGIHHGSSEFEDNTQPPDKIHASFPGFVSDMQQLWVDTFKKADFFSNSAGFDGLAFGGITATNAVDGKPGHGERSHAGREFWHTLNRRSNVTLIENVMVHKLLFSKPEHEGQIEASGVQYLEGGRVETAHIKDSGQVIICAGVFGSPQLLEWSGIGSKSVLTKTQIECLYELPGVGENLQDHLNCSISVEVKDGVKSTDIEIYDQNLAKEIVAQYQNNKSGPLAEGWVYSFAHVPSQWLCPQDEHDDLEQKLAEILNQNAVNSKGVQLRHEFIRSSIKSPSEATSTMFLVQRQRNSDLYLLSPEEAKRVPGDFISLVSMLSYPFSRGSSHVISSDCSIKPQLKFNYLTHPLDRLMLRSHMRQLDRFLELPSMSRIVKPDGIRLPRSFPRKVTDLNDEELDDMIRSTVATNYHPCGTCAMMAKSLNGVVDETFTVYGTSNVKVVDASVIPIIPRGNILTTVYALAEKAADTILQEM